MSLEISDNDQIIALTVLSLLLLGGIGWRTQWRSPYFLVCAYYFYFAFGPVILYLFGGEIYIGIVVEEIAVACMLFVLALGGLLAASLLMKPKTLLNADAVQHASRDYAVVPYILIGLSGLTWLAILLLMSQGPDVLDLRKFERQAIVGSGIHSAVLVLQNYAVALFFLVRNSKSTKIIYFANVASWIVYSLLMSERDYVYSIAVLVITIAVVDNIKFGAKQVMAGIGAIVGATALKQWSSGAGLNMTAILNQGNFLFVDTFVLDIVPEQEPFFRGYTYLDAVMGLLPGFIWDSDFSPLYWLKELWAPGGTSGYGFSLEAEAYMNFGFLGVPIFFFILGCSLIYVLNKIGTGQFWAYFAVFFTAQIMYALRNDFLFLLKGSAYAAIFFFVIFVMSPSSASKVNLKAAEDDSAHAIGKKLNMGH